MMAVEKHFPVKISRRHPIVKIILNNKKENEHERHARVWNTSTPPFR